MRCKICNIKFETKYFNQKTCLNAECVLSYSKEVVLSKWQDNARKAQKPVKKTVTSVKTLLQTEVNKLARQIDKHFNYTCIDCGKEYGKQTDGAHYHNVGGNENLRYNLHNIHSARAYCNRYNTEHKKTYPQGLIDRYGQDYYDMVEFDLTKEYPVLKLNELELKDALKIVRKLNRDFQTHLTGHLDGAMLRAYFNNLIGIYK